MGNTLIETIFILKMHFCTKITPLDYGVKIQIHTNS